MKINESITKIRQANNFTQQDIANLLQTTQQQYSKYETAKQEIPARHIITLAQHYGISTDEILGVKTYRTKEEDTNKFDKLYDEILDILYWAVSQEHINEEAKDILIENICKSKEEIENEKQIASTTDGQNT